MATSVLSVRVPRQWAEEARLLALSRGMLTNDLLKESLQRTLEEVPETERGLLSRLAMNLAERRNEG